MRGCELCKSAARIYCESDQASLCWDCDAKVHGANFLVARHTRNLLCHVCQAPTPWMGSAPKLVPTVSLCERCADCCGRTKNGAREEEKQRNHDLEDGHDEDYDDEEEEADLDEDDDEVEVEGEDEAENQVVPWSSCTPPPESSSSSEDSSNRLSSGGSDESKPLTRFSLKRLHRNASNLEFQEDLDCSSSQRNRPADGEATSSSIDSLRRPLKSRRRTEPDLACSSRLAIYDSLKRFRVDQPLATGVQASDNDG